MLFIHLFSIIFFQAKTDLATHLDGAVVSLAHLKKNIEKIEDATNEQKHNAADVQNENVIAVSSGVDATVIPKNRNDSGLAALYHTRESSPHPEKLNGNYKKGKIYFFMFNLDSICIVYIYLNLSRHI